MDEDEDDDDGDDDPSDLAKLDERLAARKLVTSTSRSSLAERVDDPSVDAISTSKIATRSTDRTDDDDDDDDDFVIEGGPIEGRIRVSFRVFHPRQAPSKLGTMLITRSFSVAGPSSLPQESSTSSLITSHPSL